MTLANPRATDRASLERAILTANGLSRQASRMTSPNPPARLTDCMRVFRLIAALGTSNRSSDPHRPESASFLPQLHAVSGEVDQPDVRALDLDVEGADGPAKIIVFAVHHPGDREPSRLSDSATSLASLGGFVNALAWA